MASRKEIKPKKAPRVSKDENYAFPVEIRGITIKGGGTVPNRMAVVRTDTGQGLSFISSKYKLITHKEVVEKFEAAIDVLKDRIGKPIIHTELPLSGTVLSRTYIFPKVKEKVCDSDICLAVKLTNSYDGSIKVGFSVGAINEKEMDEYITGGKMYRAHAMMKRHYGAPDVDVIITELDAAVNSFSEIVDEWRTWCKMPIPVEKAPGMMKKVRVPEKVKTNILESYGAIKKHTKWSLFSSVCHVLSHDIKTREVENTMLRRSAFEKNFANVFYA